VSVQEKVAIQPGQATDGHLQRLSKLSLQAILVFPAEVVMSDIRGIGEHKVKPFGGRLQVRKIPMHDVDLARAKRIP
jgi:hypothetical protein